MKKICLLVIFLLTSNSFAFIYSGPSLAISGQTIEDINTQQNFLVPKRKIEISPIKRFFLKSKQITLTLSNPRLSFACPARKGINYTNKQSYDVNVFLESGNIRTNTISAKSNWDNYLLRTSNFNWKITGKQIDNVLDGNEILIKTQIILPSPTDAWTGCIPKLHGKINFHIK